MIINASTIWVNNKSYPLWLIALIENDSEWQILIWLSFLPFNIEIGFDNFYYLCEYGGHCPTDSFIVC